MDSTSVPSAAPGTRPLWLFASLWSLRQYPTLRHEWSWSRKFSAIQAAGFVGVLSPPLQALRDRGSLRYLAITSLGSPAQVFPALRAAKELGAVAIDIQLANWDTPLAAALKLALRIRAVARDLALPFAIETHRGTFTETPEATRALHVAYRRSCGEPLPLCLDHSHFAVVRHLTPETFWPRLGAPGPLWTAPKQFHLRPFNGHHAQLPVLTPNGRRTPEYLAWRIHYATPLLAHLHAQATTQPVLAVPELGNASPSYRLSCFGDTWRDTLAVSADLRQIWRRSFKKE